MDHENCMKTVEMSNNRTFVGYENRFQQFAHVHNKCSIQSKPQLKY
jgi:hypothetical protein